MNPILIGVLAIAVLLFIMALGVPIAYAMLLVGLGGLWIEGGMARALASLVQQSYFGVAILGLTVIPMFILLGVFVDQAGITPKAFEFANKWVGRLPGGLAQATTLACALFGMVSGSSIAAVATIGKVAVPPMVDKYKYNRSLAAGVVVCSGTLAILIPPSVALAFYAILVETSISRQLMAGVIPGFLSAAIYMGMIWVRCWRNPSLAPLKPERIGWNEKLRSLPSIWEFMLIFLIVIGGIYSGLVTPTEAGAVAAFAALLLLIRRKKRQALRVVRDALWETSVTVGMLFLLLVGARVFGQYMIYMGFGRAVGEFVLGLPVPPIVALMIVLSLYYPLGMVMTTLPIMLVTLPILIPIVTVLGMDLVWLGILIVVLHESALITPPVAMNIFIFQGILPEYSFSEIVKGIWWFLAMDVVTISILFAFPQISLWLPNLMFGPGVK